MKRLFDGIVLVFYCISFFLFLCNRAIFNSVSYKIPFHKWKLYINLHVSIMLSWLTVNRGKFSQSCIALFHKHLFEQLVCAENLVVKYRKLQDMEPDLCPQRSSQWDMQQWAQRRMGDTEPCVGESARCSQWTGQLQNSLWKYCDIAQGWSHLTILSQT